MKQVTTFEQVLEELGIPYITMTSDKIRSKRLIDIETRLARVEASIRELDGTYHEPRELG